MKQKQYIQKYIIWKLFNAIKTSSYLRASSAGYLPSHPSNHRSSGSIISTHLLIHYVITFINVCTYFVLNRLFCASVISKTDAFDGSSSKYGNQVLRERKVNWTVMLGILQNTISLSLISLFLSLYLPSCLSSTWFWAAVLRKSGSSPLISRPRWSSSLPWVIRFRPSYSELSCSLKQNKNKSRRISVANHAIWVWSMDGPDRRVTEQSVYLRFSALNDSIKIIWDLRSL